MSVQGGIAWLRSAPSGSVRPSPSRSRSSSHRGELKLDGQRQRRPERPPAREQPGNGHVAVAESPGILDFASPSIVVDEAAGFALVTVVDQWVHGGRSRSITRRPAGTRLPGLDYTPASGT